MVRAATYGRTSAMGPPVAEPRVGAAVRICHVVNGTNDLAKHRGHGCSSTLGDMDKMQIDEGRIFLVWLAAIGNSYNSVKMLMP